ncbi:unnamed protein product [Timema podura]|uniref:Single domain-containing protein n=1 Tax=Timema podura TaxID=61482 RepID=A0ABN7NJ49_TIMPD|nr:unnamed protein product [Timema podura]
MPYRDICVCVGRGFPGRCYDVVLDMAFFPGEFWQRTKECVEYFCGNIHLNGAIALHTSVNWCSKMHVQSPCKLIPGNFTLQFPECFHPTEIRTSISPSSAVELNTTSALANYATETGNNESPKTLNEFDSTKILYAAAPKVKLADLSTPPQATAAKTGTVPQALLDKQK